MCGWIWNFKIGQYYLNFVRRPVQNKLNSHYIVPNAGQMPFHNASFDSQIPLLNNLKNEFWVILGCFLMLWFEQFYIHHNLEYRLIRDPRIHCFYVWLFPCMGVNTSGPEQSMRGPCVRKLLTGLIMYIYPLKIKNIVLYCIVLMKSIIDGNR